MQVEGRRCRNVETMETLGVVVKHDRSSLSKSECVKWVERRTTGDF